ncbi:MAG: protein-glutamate O-methyltransferase CheR [candidate division Zixibacteria bacterium]|nr:protein-glutamate O-methyltransferase CheR [candidate division Zixibacteria bacterium]
MTSVSAVSTSDPELNRDDFIVFRDFIHEKSGMYFPETKMYLIKNRLANRIKELGIKNYKDYFYMVKYDSGMKEFNVLMNLLTTNETSFFRNVPQLQAFSDEVLHMVIAEKKKVANRNLRIWSAGCSTGEEPYTLSMLLMEKIPDYASYNIEIVANDISENVLQAARKGIYHELSLRTTPKFYKEKYFTKTGSVYKINDIVKKKIRFSQINMTDSLKMSLIKNVDIIFCRNVTIYFSDEVKRKITKFFYNGLVKGGYYFIGHSESLHGISKAFKLLYLKNGLVYKKE